MPAIGIIQTVFIIGTLAYGSYGTKFCKCFKWDLIRLTGVNKKYDPQHVIATGIAVQPNDKIFITAPRVNEEMPCTLMYFNLTSNYSTSSSDCVTQRPTFGCWPSLADNNINSCDNIINANAGLRKDKYGRAYVVDSGIIGSHTNFRQVCPVRIHVFNDTTGEKLRMYELPALPDCFPPRNLVYFEVDSGNSRDIIYVYIVDTVSLWVYSWESNNITEFKHPFCSFDPVECNLYYGCINYQQEYSGITGLALSPTKPDGHKTLYFHALSSLREFSVCTSVLQNSSKATDNYFDFKEVGHRGCFGHSLGEVISRKTGTMIFTLIDWNATACWNPKCPYTPSNFHYLCQNAQFPNDLVIDDNNVVYVLYNELPKYIAGYLPQKGKDNFFIHCGKVEELVEGTACDPKRHCC